MANQILQGSPRTSSKPRSQRQCTHESRITPSKSLNRSRVLMLISSSSLTLKLTRPKKAEEEPTELTEESLVYLYSIGKRD